MCLTATPVTRVVSAVAAAEDADPVDLPPLYETLDPDALNALVDGSETGSVLLTFSYVGYTVTVYGDGEVEVEEERSCEPPAVEQSQPAED